MSETLSWDKGDHVVFRGVRRGKLWFAIVATVVQDSPDLIVLYWPIGTPKRNFGGRPTVNDLISTEPIELVAGVWEKTDVLMLIKPGTSHATYVMWDPGQTRFRCWYVNLQDPLRRTTIGFDSMDHILDIVIRPDRSEWRWKDEDELEDAVSVGLYTPKEAHSIRAEGERVIQQMQANQPPFCDGWENWSPPDEWEIPEFPTDWDDLSTSVDEE